MQYSLKDYSKTAAAKGWGRGWPTCDAQKRVARVTAPRSEVAMAVHKDIARLTFLVVAEMERRGYLCRPGQTWGGNCRAIGGTQSPSNHSWWLAVDINSLANAYVRKIGGRPVTDMPAWVPLLWNAFGFAWGGDYSGTKADAMHFEFMGSPQDAKDMTALAELRLAPQLDGAWVITDLLPTTPALTAAQIEENELMAAKDEINAATQRIVNDAMAVWLSGVVGRGDGRQLLGYRSDPQQTDEQGVPGDGAMYVGGPGVWRHLEPGYPALHQVRGTVGEFKDMPPNEIRYWAAWWEASKPETDTTELVAAAVAALPAAIAQEIARVVNDEADRRDRDNDPSTGVVPVGS